MNSLQLQADRLMRAYTKGGAKKHRKLQKRRLDAFIDFEIGRGVLHVENFSYAHFEAFLRKKGFRMKTELEYCRILEKFLLALPALSETNRKFLLKVRERKKFFTEKLKNDKLASPLQTQKDLF